MSSLPKKPVKPSKKEAEFDVLSIPLQREMKQKIRLIAKRERRTMSAQALLFLEEGLRHL